jgi:CxxC motif-containing protein (DUF1111 family)
VARSRSVSELGLACELLPGIPQGATISSVRNAPPLFGLGQIDGIPDAAILAGAGPRPEDDGTRVRALTAFVASLVVPAASGAGAGPGEGQAGASLVAQGASLFGGAGCIACHTAALPGAAGPVPLYSDLLLHDLGPALDDGVTQGAAGGRDWRTTPLWGLRLRSRYLHDGRARSVRAAIQAHGGEAAAAAGRFRDMTDAERDALLAFLNTL